MISVTRDGHVMTLEMQRPERRNALNAELVDGLRDAIEKAAAEDVRVVVLTGGGSQLTGLSELASNMFGRPVRLGRPRKLSGAPETAGGPDFSAATGLLFQWARDDDRLASRAEQRFLGTGTGYFAWVSEWIRDNF